MKIVDFAGGLRNALLRREGVQRVVANTIWLSFDRAIGIVNGLIIGAWVARYLGPTQYGAYIYVLTFVALFAPIAELGLSSIVVRNLVKHSYDRDWILGTTFLLQLLGGIFAFLLSVSIAYYNRSESILMYFMITIASIRLIFTCGSLVDYWFQSQIQSKFVVWVKNSVVIVIIALKVASILLQAPLMAFIVIYVIEGFLMALGLLFAYRASGHQFKAWRVDPVLGRQLLADSWPLLVSGLAIGVYVRIDKVLLGTMVGKEAVGIYSASVVFVEVWYFVPAVIAISLYPVIVRTAQVQSQEIYRQRMQYFYDAMVAFAYLITIPLIVFSRPLVILVYGEAYAAAAPVMSIYALSLVFTFVGVARGKWMVTENLNRVYMLTVILGAIMNVGLNYVLIPRYAEIGAAWATVVSYAVASYFSCAIWPSLRPAFGQITLSLFLPFRFKAIARAFNAIR